MSTIETSYSEPPSTRKEAYAGIDTAEVPGVAGGWVYQSQERHPSDRVYGERKRNGTALWARGISPVGRDESVIREYIRNQEKEAERLDQLGLWR